MQILIDISKARYDEIMSMDWKNGRRFFDEEIRAIHDGKALGQEPFINKPCVSENVCEHDKQMVLDKIKAEIDEQYDRVHPYHISCAEGLEMALEIIDKYKAEGSDKE